MQFQNVAVYVMCNTSVCNYEKEDYSSLLKGRVFWWVSGLFPWGHLYQNTCRTTLAWCWMPSCAGRQMSRKNAKSLDQNARKCICSWEEDRSCRYTISWCCTNKYWSLCRPAACSCGDARSRATLTSFNDLKTKYLGTSLVHLGIQKRRTPHGPANGDGYEWNWKVL